MKPSLTDYLEFALDTVFQAGRVTLRYFHSGISPEFKEDTSPVTVADRQTEALIRDRIESAYPSHIVLGEEYGTDDNGATEPAWYIDPIDGTKAFVRGVPLYSILLGLEIEEKIQVGVAYFPALDEMVYAYAGGGCYWNGRRCRVRETASLEDSIISCTNPAAFSEYGKGEAWERIQRIAYHVSGWSDAYGHALVATGRLELMLDPVLESYDAGPFPVILREAGGFFGDWTGNETIHGGDGLSTTQALLPAVLSVLQG